MTWFEAIILSVVEGVTEFLPVSSTGHLILASNLLAIPQTAFVKDFEIIIQLGAILAVLFLYWRRLLVNRDIFTRVLVAFIPAAGIGFILYKTITESLLGNTFVTLWALFIGGIILIVFEYFYGKKVLVPTNEQIEKISLWHSFLIGLFQSIAIIPGVSRSGASIVGGLITGLSRKDAVEFSFLLAIPTMFAATLFTLYKNNFSFSGEQTGILAIGFIGSFVTAIFAVKFFLRFIERHTFVSFGIYRILVALLFWIFIIV